jgi:glycosidase
MLALTRALLALRRSSPALHWGSYRPVGPAPPDCFVYLREHDRQTFLVALNLSAEERTVACQDFDAGKVVLSTRLDREESVNLAQLVLRPNEGCIVSIGKGNTLQ